MNEGLVLISIDVIWASPFQLNAEFIHRVGLHVRKILYDAVY